MLWCQKRICPNILMRWIYKEPILFSDEAKLDSIHRAMNNKRIVNSSINDKNRLKGLNKNVKEEGEAVRRHLLSFCGFSLETKRMFCYPYTVIQTSVRDRKRRLHET